jgi:hypothetical protein
MNAKGEESLVVIYKVSDQKSKCSLQKGPSYLYFGVLSRWSKDLHMKDTVTRPRISLLTRFGSVYKIIFSTGCQYVRKPVFEKY